MESLYSAPVHFNIQGFKSEYRLTDNISRRRAPRKKVSYTDYPEPLYGTDESEDSYPDPGDSYPDLDLSDPEDDHHPSYKLYG